MKRLLFFFLVLTTVAGCASPSRQCPPLPEYPGSNNAEVLGQYARTVVTLYADCASR